MRIFIYYDGTKELTDMSNIVDTLSKITSVTEIEVRLETIDRVMGEKNKQEEEPEPQKKKGRWG